jgi:hypothetical protein
MIAIILYVPIRIVLFLPPLKEDNFRKGRVLFLGVGCIRIIEARLK